MFDKASTGPPFRSRPPATNTVTAVSVFEINRPSPHNRISGFSLVPPPPPQLPVGLLVPERDLGVAPPLDVALIGHARVSCAVSGWGADDSRD